MQPVRKILLAGAATLALLILAFMAALAAAAAAEESVNATADSPNATAATGSPIPLTVSERRMAVAINAYRARHSLAALTVDVTLMTVARDRAAHCSVQTPHQVRGLWPWDDCRRHGYRGFATENMAFGDLSPEEAVDGWAHSSVGHWRQMLGQFEINDRWTDQHFTKLGVAQSGTRFVALFGN